MNGLLENGVIHAENCLNNCFRDCVYLRGVAQGSNVPLQKRIQRNLLHSDGKMTKPPCDVTVPPMSLGDQIRNFRESTLKLSQEQFARGLGVHRRTLQDWEYGVFSPEGASLKYVEHLMECISARQEFVEVALKKKTSAPRSRGKRSKKSPRLN